MEQCYTDNFLLKYLYRETSITQTLEIEHLIETDATTKSQYDRLRAGYKYLPKVLFYPSDSAMENIMKYSTQSAALNPSF